jgi:hypothetical protein
MSLTPELINLVYGAGGAFLGYWFSHLFKKQELSFGQKLSAEMEELRKTLDLQSHREKDRYVRRSEVIVGLSSMIGPITQKAEFFPFLVKHGETQNELMRRTQEIVEDLGKVKEALRKLDLQLSNKEMEESSLDQLFLLYRDSVQWIARWYFVEERSGDLNKWKTSLQRDETELLSALKHLHLQ